MGKEKVTKTEEKPKTMTEKISDSTRAAVEIEKQMRIHIAAKSSLDPLMARLQTELVNHLSFVLLNDFENASRKESESSLWKWGFYKSIEEFRKLIKKTEKVLSGKQSGDILQSIKILLELREADEKKRLEEKEDAAATAAGTQPVRSSSRGRKRGGSDDALKSASETYSQKKSSSSKGSLNSRTKVAKGSTTAEDASGSTRGAIGRASPKTIFLAEQISNQLKAQFVDFLNHASSFYSTFSNNLIAKYAISLDMKIDPEKAAQSNETIWKAHSTAQRCFIYLGDIARYREQLLGRLPSKQTSESRFSLGRKKKKPTLAPPYEEAISYYMQAIRLLPANGNPHNQLAVVATYNNDHLEAIYRYFRALGVSAPFVTARDNLALLFERNRSAWHTIEKQQRAQRASPSRRTNRSASPTNTSSFSQDGSRKYSPRRSGAGPGLTNRVVSPKVSFLTAFVRLHGILFTKTHTETFIPTLLQAMNDFEICILSSASDQNITEEEVLKIIVCNIFALHNTEFQDDPTLSDNPIVIEQRKELQYLALSLIWSTFLTLLSTTRVPELDRLLPLTVFIGWLSSNYDWWNLDDEEKFILPSASFEKKHFLKTQLQAWRKFATTHRRLGDAIYGKKSPPSSHPSSTQAIDKSTSLIALVSDYEIRGFLPLAVHQKATIFASLKSAQSLPKKVIQQIIYGRWSMFIEGVIHAGDEEFYPGLFHFSKKPVTNLTVPYEFNEDFFLNEMDDDAPHSHRDDSDTTSIPPSDFTTTSASTNNQTSSRSSKGRKTTPPRISDHSRSQNPVRIASPPTMAAPPEPSPSVQSAEKSPSNNSGTFSRFFGRSSAGTSATSSADTESRGSRDTRGTSSTDGRASSGTKKSRLNLFNGGSPSRSTPASSSMMVGGSSNNNSSSPTRNGGSAESPGRRKKKYSSPSHVHEIDAVTASASGGSPSRRGWFGGRRSSPTSSSARSLLGSKSSSVSAGLNLSGVVPETMSTGTNGSGTGPKSSVGNISITATRPPGRSDASSAHRSTTSSTNTLSELSQHSSQPKTFQYIDDNFKPAPESFENPWLKQDTKYLDELDGEYESETMFQTPAREELDAIASPSSSGAAPPPSSSSSSPKEGSGTGGSSSKSESKSKSKKHSSSSSHHHHHHHHHRRRSRSRSKSPSGKRKKSSKERKKYSKTVQEKERDVTKAMDRAAELEGETILLGREQGQREPASQNPSPRRDTPAKDLNPPGPNMKLRRESNGPDAWGSSLAKLQQVLNDQEADEVAAVSSSIIPIARSKPPPIANKKNEKKKKNIANPNPNTNTNTNSNSTASPFGFGISSPLNAPK